MNKTIINRIKLSALALLLLAVLSVVYLLMYNLAEPKVYDFFNKTVLTQKLPFDAHKKLHGDDNIVLVVIDAKSVEKYRWPWKRELYCDILKYFSKYASPKVLVHDTIITTPDTDNPESDSKYYASVQKMPKYVSGFLPARQEWQDKTFGEKYDTEFADKFAVKVLNDTNNMPELFSSMFQMPQKYLESLRYAGSVLMITGPISGNILFADEICRNQNYFIKYKGNYYPSLAMKTFMLLNKTENVVLTKKEIQFPEINYKIKHKCALFQTVVPIRFYGLYPSGYSHKHYSAIDIINSSRQMDRGQKPLLSPELFRDKIIVFGANVPAGAGLNDNKNSSISVNHPGVDIQATAIDNLMNHESLYVIPQWINLIVAVLGMLFVYFLIRMFDTAKSIPALLVLILGYVIACAVCYYFYIIINIVTPISMFILTTIFAYTHKYIIENRSKEKVKSAMGKYMSQDVMKNVVQNIDNLGLGGKKAVVTVLFADIRGFTSMSEKMSAQQVSEFLNEYFSEMEPIITEYNGIINKFIGDAIMAVFGEPIQDEKHAVNAVKCAYAMLKRVERLRKKWAGEGKPEIEIGIGINTGEVFIGNIGSVNRMEYTVIGDTVNLASRLESYNKIYKTKLLISTSTYKQVSSFADVIKIPDVQIRGKANKMDIYEVLKVTDNK